MLDIIELNPNKWPWIQKVKANNNMLWKEKVQKHQEKVPIASRFDFYKTFIGKCELFSFSSSLSVISNSRHVFKYHRALKKENTSQNLTINENFIIIIKNQDSKLGMWLFISVYKIDKITYIIVRSEVSEIRTCMLQICVVT